MSSQSSGDRPPDEPVKDNQPRPLTIPSSKSTLTSVPRSNPQFQNLSKNLNRPVVQLQNVSGVIPPAHCSAQALHAILPAAGISPGILASNVDLSKSSLTTNPLNFSTLTPASTSSTQMMSSTQIVRVATPGISQSNIVQISAPTAVTSSTTHVAEGSILKSHIPSGFPSHLPRGAAAASVLAAPKSNTAVPMLRPSHHAIHVPMSSSATGIHVPRASLISSATIRTTTPPSTRPISPVVSIATTLSESHRPVKPAQTTTAPSIQITVQAPRPTTDMSQKPVITHQHTVPKPVHLTHGISSTTSKMLMTQTPITQHSVLSNLSKTNKATIPASSVTTFASSSVGNMTMASTSMSSINSLPAASSIIPVAKVNPVRQQQPASLTTHHTTRPSGPVTTHEYQRTESSSQLTSHSSQASTHSLPHSQTPSASLFIPQTHRPITSTITMPGTVSGIDARSDRTSSTNPLPLQFLPPEYQFMFQQIAANQLAQASSIRPSMLNQMSNLSATFASVHGLAATTQPLQLDHSMLMRQTPLALYTQSVNSAFTTSSEGTIRPTTPKDASSSTVSSSLVITTASIPVSVPALSAIAMASSMSSLSTASSNLYINAGQNPGITMSQFQSNQSNNTPVTNANSSPRPSILRKRTNEGITVVKKPVCGLNTLQEKLPDRNSPRPDSRTDSAPQSNTSSPKTPATPAGESQSSTDTALSSEATTPTQNVLSELRIKQEPPDTIENGFPNSNSLPNSTETSPRKKPRKQLLHVNEELKDSTSSDDDFDDDDDDRLDIKEEFEFKDEYVDDEGIRWTLEKNRPNISLLNFYNISWKSRNNHFQRYSDVKPKDERRPTVNELSNQRGVMQKASGWKLYHMAAQMEDLTGLEKTLHQKVLSLQESIAPEPVRQHAPEDDSGLLHELTQANLQRSKLIADQLEEARTSMLKVLDHKTKIFEIINKHMSKRPIKKKERS